MSLAIASSRGVVEALAGPSYGTIAALFLPNTSVVVAGVGTGVVVEDIVVDFAAPVLPAAAAAVEAAAAAGVAAEPGAAAAAVGLGAADSAVAAAAAVAATAAAEAAEAAEAAGAAAVDGSAFVVVVLLGSVGLAPYPVGVRMPMALRYLLPIPTENPLCMWMMACVGARMYR